ncbi:MAG: cupin domain-containing protein [Actinomycetes bacterium]
MEAQGILLSDDGVLRVMRWEFEPGAETGVHTHMFDYVVVPVTGGTFRALVDGQESDYVQVAGESYSRNRGVTHNVTNVGDAFASFVEIEVLTT